MAARKKSLGTAQMGTVHVEVDGSDKVTVTAQLSDDSPLAKQGAGPNTLHGCTGGFQWMTLSDGRQIGFNVNVIEKPA